MKKFVVILSDKQRNLMLAELIKGHVAYLKALKEKGVLLFCGPCTDGTAVMIIDAPSLEKAKELVEGDPFSEVDYYKERRIVEIEEANEENGFFLEKVLAGLGKI
ncbi:YciI family protein [Bacillus sp. FSL W7-1360]